MTYPPLALSVVRVFPLVSLMFSEPKLCFSEPKLCLSEPKLYLVIYVKHSSQIQCSYNICKIAYIDPDSVVGLHRLPYSDPIS